MITPKLDCAVQVIGLGIAGLGIAIAADRNKSLDNLCQAGLVYFDKRSANKFESLRFDILSNSPASDFIGGIRPDGMFSPVLNSPNGKKLRELADQETPLTLVSDFFRDSAEHLCAALARYQRSDFISETAVAALRLNQGSITSLDVTGKPLVTSGYAVIATGGAEKHSAVVASLASALGAASAHSENVLRSDCDARIDKLITSQQRILVVGGSHSGFSVVDYLLRHFGHRLTDAQVLVLARDPIKMYYESVKEFNDCSADDEHCAVDFETQRVNRYNGLRCDAKKLYQSIASGRERRVKILFNACDEDQYVNMALNKLNRGSSQPIGLLVQAVGYRANAPALFDSAGRRLKYANSQGSVALSRDYQVQDENYRPYPGLFGLGLGSFVPSVSPYSVTREVPVGVNIYHRKDAEKIIAKIRLQMLESESSTTVADSPMSGSKTFVKDLC